MLIRKPKKNTRFISTIAPHYPLGQRLAPHDRTYTVQRHVIAFPYTTRLSKRTTWISHHTVLAPLRARGSLAGRAVPHTLSVHESHVGEQLHFGVANRMQQGDNGGRALPGRDTTCAGWGAWGRSPSCPEGRRYSKGPDIAASSISEAAQRGSRKRSA